MRYGVITGWRSARVTRCRNCLLSSIVLADRASVGHRLCRRVALACVRDMAIFNTDFVWLKHGASPFVATSASFG